MVCETAVPTGSFPKAALEGVAVIPDCTPLPVTGITALAPCALTLIFPVTVSELIGLKETFIVALCPAGSTNGVVIPEVETSLAFTVNCEMVRLEFPLLVRVTLLELELPALMVPKLKLVGAAAIETDAATPIPVNATVEGEPGALLEMVTVPLKVPALVGAN
jgi:hypothetical protein